MVDAATGSGKSTLVPLFLAEQCLQAGEEQLHWGLQAQAGEAGVQSSS